eukprot:gb/GEZN01005635.1/.p1 GENE.gb/GEZN01005635.1/~~gb/GEZN01005635.1/.p1  ORF type:complete len:456 (-),score=60.95 gb/GEZN01005635.1/:262-1629(-)
MGGTVSTTKQPSTENPDPLDPAASNSADKASQPPEQKRENNTRSLCLDEQGFEDLFSPQLWQDLCPFLTVTGLSKNSTENHELKLSTSGRDYKAEFVQNGFFQWDASSEQTPYFQLIDRLARGVSTLVEQGYPATFIYAYEEAWELVRAYTPILQASNGGSEFLGDIFAWKVDPVAGQRGWGPHRDRMGSGPDSFRTTDQTPMLSTTWLALTDATTANSCLYFVPAAADPMFREKDEPEVDPLARAFSSNPDAFQSIRACPISRGSFVHFSHRTIHWGSFAAASESFSKQQAPRIAMSWVVGDVSFEQPAVVPATAEQKCVPRFQLGVCLALVAAQQILYSGQTNLPRRRKTLFFRMFEKHSSSFSAFYTDKVRHLHFLRESGPEPVLSEKHNRKPVFDPNSKLDRSEIKQNLEEVDGVGGLFPDSSEEEESAEEESEEEDEDDDEDDEDTIEHF